MISTSTVTAACTVKLARQHLEEPPAMSWQTVLTLVPSAIMVT